MNGDGMTRWSWMTKGLLGALVLVITSSSAFAQFGRSFRDIGNPEIDSTQIDTIADMLGFSEEQTEFASELLQGYLGDMTKLSDEVRMITDGARQEFRETRDPSVWQDVMGAMEPLQEEKDAISERFMEDLRLILDADQDKRWIEVERYHRRYTSFSDDGLLSGETVDVIQAVTDMELPEEQMETLRPVLEQYAAEIDRALATRNKVYEESMQDAMELWRNQDFDEMERRYEKSRDEATKVRDLNRRYARQVEVVLAAEYAAEWSEEFKERSFPRVYRPTATGRAIEAAIAFDDLSPEQLDLIEELRAEYRKRTTAMNDGIAQAIEEGEMNRGVQSFFGRGRGGESQEIRDARTERRELDQAMLSRLRATLTDDQAARLPEREDNSNWRDRLPRRGGGGGGGGEGRDRPRSL